MFLGWVLFSGVLKQGLLKKQEKKQQQQLRVRKKDEEEDNWEMPGGDVPS
jgi:hypothetical protein